MKFLVIIKCCKVTYFTTVAIVDFTIDYKDIVVIIIIIVGDIKVKYLVNYLACSLIREVAGNIPFKVMGAIRSYSFKAAYNLEEARKPLVINCASVLWAE